MIIKLKLLILVLIIFNFICLCTTAADTEGRWKIGTPITTYYQGGGTVKQLASGGFNLPQCLQNIGFSLRSINSLGCGLGDSGILGGVICLCFASLTAVLINFEITLFLTPSKKYFRPLIRIYLSKVPP